MTKIQLKKFLAKARPDLERSLLIYHLGHVEIERDRYRKVCQRLVEHWDKLRPSWPIVDIVEKAREALKGGKRE